MYDRSRERYTALPTGVRNGVHTVCACILTIFKEASIVTHVARKRNNVTYGPHEGGVEQTNCICGTLMHPFIRPENKRIYIISHSAVLPVDEAVNV